MGMPGAFRAGAETTLVLKDQHIRFMREARPGAPLHMVAGLLDIGETEARLYAGLIHSLTGELAASFQSVVAHVTSRDLRPFPWSRRTLALAAGLTIEAPPQARPRSLDLEPSSGAARLETADRLGMLRIGAGAICAADCDVFGRMAPEVLIGRVSDGVPTLRARLGGEAREASVSAPRVGGAVLEYRIAYLRWPRAGARFEIRSALRALDERTQTFVHWVLDTDTGAAWGSALAVAVALDLDARKIIPVSAEDRARLAPRVTPDALF
jgi:acyl-CoA thioester hydrolase